MPTEINKEELMNVLAGNIKVLRNKLQLTQAELASKIGISRQTLINIENKKRDMTWGTFVALICVFKEDEGTRDLMEHFNIYTSDLSRYLITPEQPNIE